MEHSEACIHVPSLAGSRTLNGSAVVFMCATRKNTINFWRYGPASVADSVTTIFAAGMIKLNTVFFEPRSLAGPRQVLAECWSLFSRQRKLATSSASVISHTFCVREWSLPSAKFPRRE